jgi:hypothetical protein
MLTDVLQLIRRMYSKTVSFLQQTGGAHTVLRVIVEHMVYPVTLDVIHQIFSRVGKVIKIVTFTKNNTFQVTITW